MSDRNIPGQASKVVDLGMRPTWQSHDSFVADDAFTYKMFLASA